MLRKRKELILAVVFTVCLLIIVQSSVLNSFFASKALSRNKKKQEKVVLGRKQLIPEPKEVIRKQPSSGVPALEKPVEVTTTSQLETISRLKKKSFKRY